MGDPSPEGVLSRARRPVSVPWLVVLCLWVAFIWGNSLVVGSTSDAGSHSVASLLEPIFWFLSVRDPHLMNYVVRKAAHFAEYAVFGFLDGLAFNAELMAPPPVSVRTRGWQRGAFAILLAVPIADELIQRVVPGRDGNVTDVLIDIAGASLGMMVAMGLTHLTTPPRGRPAGDGG